MTWKWGQGQGPPVVFTEFHNPSHRDFESPFEVLDPQALGSLLLYDTMWVRMDDEGVGMAKHLDVECGLFFVPLAEGSWRCTWPGRLLGSDGQVRCTTLHLILASRPSTSQRDGADAGVARKSHQQS